MQLKFFTKLCLILLFAAFAHQKTQAASDIFDGYAILNSTYYDLVTATGNPDFQGANLGNFLSSSSITLGGEIKTYKNGSDNICGGKIWYSIYPASGSPGTFTNIALPYDAVYGDQPSGMSINQQWQANPGTSITLPASAGAYKIAVYVTDSGDSSGGCTLDPFHTNNNSGAYWIADFTVGILINGAAEGGFELGTTFADNGWTVVNTATSNASQWFLGGSQTNGAYSFNATGSRVAYASNNAGTNWRYNTSAASGSSHFYRDIAFPSGQTNINLSFRWNANGETIWDILYVYLCPTTLTPVANSPSGSANTVVWSGSGSATLLGSFNLLAAGSGQTNTVAIPASLAGNCAANSNMRLVFTWKNDGSGGGEPPAAVDDIHLTAAAPLTTLSGGTFTIDNTLPTGGTNFNSFTAAISDINATLNCGALTGPITFNVIAGQTFNENPPALTASGNSAANFIKFQKSGAGANPKITPTGGGATTDFGFCITGGDYITVDGIDIDASAAVAVEYGYLLRNASATNGAQNNTIQNTTITLGSRAGTNTSYGILQTAGTNGGGVAPTNAAGANSNNVYYNLNISGVRSRGISLEGATAFPDLNCRIGTTSCTTRNNISNIGPTVSATGADGIRAVAQSGVWIFNNNISAIAGYLNTAHGILIHINFGSSEVFGNDIKDISVFGSTSTTDSAYGVKVGNNTTGTHNVRIYNNAIANLFTSRTSASATRYVYGIFAGVTGATNSQSYDVDNNTVSIGQGLNIAISSSCFEVQNNASVYRIRGNIFANYTAAQGTARHYAARFTGAGWGAAGSVCDYNDYYIANDLATSGFISLVNTTNNATLAAHQAALTSPASQDANSQTIDPQLTNPNTDLHASASGLSAVSGYTPQTWVVNDIECADRTTAPGASPHDWGAYVVFSCVGANGGTISPTTQDKCDGQTASMTATGASTGAGITYQWEVSATGGGVGFADVVGGTGATTVSYTTAALTPGIYYYRLRVTCSSGPTTGYSNELAVTVNNLPAASVSPSTAQLCGSGSVDLTASGGGTYLWSTSATTAMISVSPASTTTYTVTVTNANGCTATANSTVTVDPLPIIQSISATPPAVCIGGTSNLAVVVGGVGTFTGTAVTLSDGNASPYPSTISVSGLAGNIIGLKVMLTNLSHTWPNDIDMVLFGPDNSTHSIIFTDAIGGSGGITGRNYTFQVGATALPLSGFPASGTYGVVNGTAYSGAGTPTAVTNTGLGVFNGTNPNGTWKLFAYDDTGGDTGSLGSWSIEITTGAPVTNYAWSPATYLDNTTIANPTASNVMATTTYTVTVSTAAGCTATNSVTLSAGNPLVVSPTASPTTICLNSSTVVSAGATGGGAPYTYVWEDSSTDATRTLSPASSTTYSVTVTDNCGVTASGSVSVTVNGLPTVSVTPSSYQRCLPEMPITLQASGAVTYTWAPATGLSTTTGDATDASPLTNTTYTVTGTDANGCTATASAVITVNNSPSLNMTATPATICEGGSTQLLADAFILPVTYTQSTPAFFSENCASLPNNGPAGDDGVSAPNNIGFTFKYYGVDYTQFGISTNGNIQLGDGVSPVYSGAYTDVAIPNAATPNNLIALAWDDWSITPGEIKWGTIGTPGSQRLVVCFSTSGRGSGSADNIDGQIILEEGTNKIYIVTVNKDVSANTVTQGIEDATGSAASSAVSGRNNQAWSATNSVVAFTPNTPAFTYNWSPSGDLDNATISNPLASNLSTTTSFSVSVTDPGTGCQTTGSVSVTVDPAPTASVSPSSAVLTCTTSSATLTASGSGTYLWDDNSTDAARTVMSAGTYTVTVTGTNGCTAIATASVTSDTAAPSASVSPSSAVLTCTTTSATLTASGSGTYLWDDNSTDAARTVMSAGTYTVTVTGSNGCTATASASVTSDTTPPTASVSPSSAVLTCTTTSVMLTASGSGTYLWDDSSTDAARTVMSAGTYTVTVTGSNGCTATASASVTSDTTPPTASVSPSSAVLTCTTTSVMLTASGSGTYLWDDSSTDAARTVMSAGTYTVTVTGSNGCTATASASVTSDTTPPTASVSPSSAVLTCTTTSVMLTASGSGTYLWDDSSTDAARTVMSAGTYTVTVTGSNGCTATASASVTSDTTPPTASVSPSSAVLTCTTTSVMLTASGSGTYLWDDSSTDAARTVMSAGTYTVTVTGSNGCTATASASVTSDTTPPTASVSPSSAVLTCTTSSATLTASGSGTYLWDDNSTDAARIVTAAGTYTVTVTGTNGCTATASASVTSDTTPPTAGVSPSSAVLTCTTTSATLTASGSGTYLWDDNSTDAARTVTAAGTYTVTVTGTNGCTATASASVTSDTTPPTASVSPSSAVLTCTTTSATLTASGSGTYLWDDSSTDAARTVMSAGTYTVTVTGSNGCTATASASVTSDTTPPTASVSPSSAVLTCTTTSVMLTASGSGTYLWDDSSTDAARTVMSAGTYTVTVTGSNGCTATASASVTSDTTPPTASVSPSSAVLTCTTTSVMLTASGSGTYLWDDSSTDAARTVMSAGTYTVTVTGSNGCTATASASVTSDTTPPTASVSPSSAVLTCTTTSATLTASGSGTYLWDDNSTDAARTVTAAGTYTVTVTGTNGCTATASASVTSDTTPPTAGVSPSSAVLTCTTTSATLTASGSGTYLWDDNSTDAARTVTAAGTYTVTVTGTNGCTATASASVTSDTTPPTASVSPSSAVLTCTTTSATLTASGSGTYLWDDNSTDAARTVTAAGTYTVTVTGTNGCTATASASVTSDTTPPTASVSPSSAVLTCTTTSATLTASGSGTYLWDDNSTDAARTVTAAGTYTVTVTGTNGCTATASASVTSDTTPPTASVSPSSAVLTCTTTSATLTASGSGTYLWDDNSTDAARTVMSAGTYTVTVTGSNGCTATASASVTSDTTPPTASVSPSSAVLTCTTTSATLTASGSGTYLWDDNSTDAARTVMSAGTYTVTVTGSNGCTATASASVTSDTTPPTASVSPSSAVLTCTTTSATLTASGSGTYLWDDNSTDAARTVMSAGTYTVTVTGSNGCTATASASVTSDTTPPTASVSPSSAVLTCTTTSATLTASGSGTYLWDDNSTDAARTVMSAGTYTVTVTGSNGCTATASASVTSDTTPPTASVSPSSAVLTCTTTSATLTASGSGTYLWDDNSTDAARTVMSAGTYTVTVTGSNGCTATASASVTSDTTPPSATISGAASYCVGNTISLSASAGGASYAWSGPSFTANTASISRPSATVAMSGTYTVTVTGSNGCTATASQVVTVNANPTANITGPSSVCVGSTLALTASGGVSYAWSGPGGFAAATATMTRTGMTAAMAGTYTVTVTNASGCTASASRTVAVNALPAATAGSNSPVCTGATINLTASGGVTYAWSGPGFSSSLQNPSRGSATLAMAGTYTVTVTNASGCTATASTTVAVNSCGAVLNVVSYSIGKDNGTSNGSITLNVAGGTPCTGNTYNYAWSGPSSGSATGGSSFVISPLATGWYTVTITDCAGNSKVVSYFVPLATRGRTKAEGISFDGLTAYPNPTSDVSTIKFTSWSNERMYLAVYSMDGREVAVLFDGIAEEEADYELSLPVSDLAAGVYNVLLVSQSGYRETLRIVVTK